jgi:hypothetical protein
MTEDTEQDVDRGNDERIRESDVARAPTQCVKKHEVWRDACESPREAKAVHGEGCAGHAESTIPSDNAQDDFGCDLGSNGRSELLNGCCDDGRKMSGDVDLARLRARRKKLFELFGDFGGGGHEAEGTSIRGAVRITLVAACKLRDRKNASDKHGDRSEKVASNEKVLPRIRLACTYF